MFIELTENNSLDIKVSISIDFIGSIRASKDGCSEVCTKDGIARKYKIEYSDLLHLIQDKPPTESLFKKSYREAGDDFCGLELIKK